MSNRPRQLALAALALTACGAVHADGCLHVAGDAGDAQVSLDRVASTTRLTDAQALMGQVRHALNKAADDARDCRCDSAVAAFTTAATYAGGARNALERDEFQSQYLKALNAYDYGVGASMLCAQSRGR